MNAIINIKNDGPSNVFKSNQKSSTLPANIDIGSNINNIKQSTKLIIYINQVFFKYFFITTLNLHIFL